MIITWHEPNKRFKDFVPSSPPITPPRVLLKFSILLFSFFHLGATTSLGSGETTQGGIEIGEH